MLKAILFDMDGVIIDSEPLHARAAILALQRYGVTLSTEFCYSFIGSTAKHMLEVIQKEHHLNVTIEELMEANQQAKLTLLKTEGYPAIPFVRELMEALKHSGFQLAIASSSPLEEIGETVERLQLSPFLTACVSGMQVAHPKPAPDIFLAAARELGVSPSECLVIEDSCNGLNAAKSAGMVRIAFHNPNSGNQDLSSANYVIEGFEEITPEFIQQVYQHGIGEPAVIIKTKHLIIRELALSDLVSLRRITSLPEVSRWIGEPALSLAEQSELHQAYIRNSYHFCGYGLWGVFSLENDTLMGRCGIQNTEIDGHPEIELGYLLAPEYWGSGLAEEMVQNVLSYCRNAFHISRFVSVIAKENVRSAAFAQHLGFYPEKELDFRGQACTLYVINENQM